MNALHRGVLVFFLALAIALSGTALAVAVSVAQAQTDANWCPPYAYYNTGVGRCVTNPPDDAH
jgi:hypothetical protein